MAGLERMSDCRGVRLQRFTVFTFMYGLCVGACYTGLMSISFGYTVKPVYNNHSRDQVIVVSVDRWSLYRGALVQLKWTMN